jgi:hypothetical protein
MVRSMGVQVGLAAILLICAGCAGKSDEPEGKRSSALKGPVAAATGICPPTVTIGGCDSGVAATVGDKCIQEAVDQCLTGVDSHGAFVSCVSHAIKDLVDGRDRGEIMRCAAHAGGDEKTKRPDTNAPPGPRPSEILAGRQLHQPPPLETAADVEKFVDWASSSAVEEREDGRAVIAKASGNMEIAQALIGMIESTQQTDHSRTLIELAILGEMRNPLGVQFLYDFATRPLPTTGTLVEGEILENTAQAMLQAKATHGLAYWRGEGGDFAVLSLVENHPSRIVRAEAVSAFLFNQGDSPEGRDRALAAIKKRLSRIQYPTQADQLEVLFVDRVRRVAGESAAIFNAKLAAYLRLHPEAFPPDPVKGGKTAAPKTSPSFDEQPPPL